MSVCNICKTSTTRYCSICHKVYYCSIECQKKDWKAHKVHCKTLDVHGQNAHPVLVCHRKVKKLLACMNIPQQNCVILMIDMDIQGDPRTPYTNVLNVIDDKGGTAVCGWMLYENEHMVEAEAWCAWRPPNEDFTLNVTPSDTGKPFGGLFATDIRVSEFIEEHNSFPENKVLWK